MFVIDFDDTLFDSQKFKHTRMRDVMHHGVSEDEFWHTYKQARNSSDGLFTYSNTRHAQELALLGYSQESMMTALEKTTGDALQTFLFPGARTFLHMLKDKGVPLVLLSLGDPSFQELKVVGSGIHDYFDRTFMVEGGKVDVIARLAADHDPAQMWFINDKIEETQTVHAKFPQMQVVLKESPLFATEAYEESGFVHFDSLEQIHTYVETKLG